MSMVTSIAALSVAQYQVQLKTDVATALLGKVIDQNKETAAALLEMMQSAGPAIGAGSLDLRV